MWKCIYDIRVELPEHILSHDRLLKLVMLLLGEGADTDKGRSRLE